VTPPPTCTGNTRHSPNTSACVPITTTVPPRTLAPTPAPCPSGTARNAQGQCVPIKLQINPNLLKQINPQTAPR
jgi:hypothetical protein